MRIAETIMMSMPRAAFSFFARAISILYRTADKTGITNTNESIQLAAVKTASKSRELSKSARRTIRYETANSFVCNIALPGKNIPVPAATAASIQRAGSGKSRG